MLDIVFRRDLLEGLATLLIFPAIGGIVWLATSIGRSARVGKRDAER